MIPSTSTTNHSQFIFPPQDQSILTPCTAVSNPVNLSEEIQMDSRTKMSIAHLVDDTYERVIVEAPAVVNKPVIPIVTNKRKRVYSSRVWPRENIEILYKCMCLNIFREQQYEQASVQLNKTSEACRHYWRKHKIVLKQDLELIKHYGVVKNISSKLTLRDEIIIYTHLTYCALEKDNLSRASNQIKKSLSTCNNFWQEKKEEWQNSEDLKKQYGALFSKSLPINPETHEELKTFEVTCIIEAPSPTSTGQTRSSWEEKEKEILYEEMTYKGPIIFNYQMASKRLRTRTVKACKGYWCLHKKELVMKFIVAYGDVDSRDRFVPENFSYKSSFLEVNSSHNIPNLESQTEPSVR